MISLSDVDLHSHIFFLFHILIPSQTLALINYVHNNVIATFVLINYDCALLKNSSQFNKLSCVHLT